LEGVKAIAMITLVLQSFGKEYEYKRAIFAIWSVWTHFDANQKVILFTDNQAYFEKYFEGQEVTYINLSAAKIKSMRGEIDFLHRMKIALIEEAFKIANTHLLYIDSDTFFISSPQNEINETFNGVVHMHLPEYPFSSIPNLPLPSGINAHRFFELITKNSFKLSNDEEIKIDPDFYSWNAGVMFLPMAVRNHLADVYALTEQFFPPTQNHAAEQFAFSIIFQRSFTIKPCDNTIHHYWYRVDKIVMDEWLEQKINLSWAIISRQQKEDFMKKWTANLPRIIEKHVLMLRDRAIQAFHEKKYTTAYSYAFRAIVKAPMNKKFLYDILYHTKKMMYARFN
jgi:hypothetical protein